MFGSDGGNLKPASVVRKELEQYGVKHTAGQMIVSYCTGVPPPEFQALWLVLSIHHRSLDDSTFSTTYIYHNIWSTPVVAVVRRHSLGLPLSGAAVGGFRAASELRRVVVGMVPGGAGHANQRLVPIGH